MEASRKRAFAILTDFLVLKQLRDLRKDNNRLETDLEDKDKVRSSSDKMSCFFSFSSCSLTCSLSCSRVSEAPAEIKLR